MENSSRTLKLPSVEGGIFDLISRWMAILAAILIGMMMMIDVVDVTGRYFFLKPLPGALDIIPLLLVCGGSLAMASCEVRRSHIVVSILVDRFPRRLQAILMSFGYLVALGVFFLISWRLFLKGAEEAGKELGWSSQVIGVPFSPFLFIFAVGVGIFCIALVLRLLHSIFNASSREIK